MATAAEKAAAKAAKEEAARVALVAELAEFNITETGGTDTITPLSGKETVDELKEILKQAKADAKAAAKADVGSVTVVWAGGSRVYSKDVHGEDFRDLAEEFAGKKGGKVK